MHTKISTHFDIREFVPKYIFNKYGAEKSKWFIRPQIVDLAEFVREWFKAPVIINNWYSGGIYQERGYRTPHSTTGAKYSQHRFGSAIDINIKGFSPEYIYEEILANEKAFMEAGLTTLENVEYTKTWNHLDIRWHNDDHILIVDP